MNSPGQPQAARCYCDSGELCRHCLGDSGGLLVAVCGGDGVEDASELYRRAAGRCYCDEGELCRLCAPKGLQELVLDRLGEPWRQAPEALKQLLSPLDWLAKTAEDN